MANGDIAAAAGIPIVPGTAKVKMGYDEINLTRDVVATRTTRAFLDIYVQAAEPTGPRKVGRLWIHPA